MASLPNSETEEVSASNSESTAPTQFSPGNSEVEVSTRGNVGLAAASVGAALLLFLGTHFGGSGADLKMLSANSIPYDQALANGFPTVVEFYADWCEVCRELSNDVYNVEAKYKDKVNFVMLNIDNVKWAEELNEFGVEGIPHFVFLDKQQNELGYVVGRLPSSVLEANIEALAKEESTVPYSEVVGQFSSKEGKDVRPGSTDPRSHG